MRHALITLAAAAAAAILPAGALAATLDEVKERGFLRCGVSQGVPGFSVPDQAGTWTGIDVDYCRAIAAAIFDDPEAVRYTPLSAKERFTALTAKEFDVLSRNTTETMSRDVELALSFGPVIFYDGQGFIVRRAAGVTAARELDGASICTQTGTTTELNLADFFRANSLEYQLVKFEKNSEAITAYDEGRCDAYTTDRSALFAERTRLKNPDEHMILPDVISKEPLAPVVRQGDPQWEDLTRWVLFAMINAEELGVTRDNLDEMLDSPSPEIRRLLGKEGSFGESLGLTNDWVYRIVRHVGNYGEIYDRNVGEGSVIKIDRGLNNLWNAGGILYAPPVR